jgi:hypothetical protein
MKQVDRVAGPAGEPKKGSADMDAATDSFSASRLGESVADLGELPWARGSDASRRKWRAGAMEGNPFEARLPFDAGTSALLLAQLSGLAAGGARGGWRMRAGNLIVSVPTAPGVGEAGSHAQWVAGGFASDYRATSLWEDGGWDGYNTTLAGFTFLALFRALRGGAWRNAFLVGHLASDRGSQIANLSPAEVKTVDFGHPRSVVAVLDSAQTCRSRIGDFDVKGYNGSPARRFLQAAFDAVDLDELLSEAFYARRERDALSEAAGQAREIAEALRLVKGEEAIPTHAGGPKRV